MAFVLCEVGCVISHRRERQLIELFYKYFSPTKNNLDSCSLGSVQVLKVFSCWQKHPWLGPAGGMDQAKTLWPSTHRTNIHLIVVHEQLKPVGKLMINLLKLVLSAAHDGFLKGSTWKDPTATCGWLWVPQKHCLIPFHHNAGRHRIGEIVLGTA